jgi:hypothetical protein
MKLLALRLHNVRRFAGSGVAVEGMEDGVNVLCAANEFGKSTCFDALHALFFQPHSGAPWPVQSLRPYSGGSPLIQVDVATGNGRFRLSKQFYSGRKAMVADLGSGRLLHQADEAERFIADLVRGGTLGPAGLLWVRQGNTGIEKKSSKDEEGEKRARETVLSSVQGEVEALTGGRRMIEAAASCDVELSRLLTATGRPKADGPYAQALKARDEQVALERRLDAEVQNLRGALDARRKVLGRLAELENPDTDAARRKAVEAAEQAFSAAQRHGEVFKRAEAEAALARNRRDDAALKLGNYRSALDRAKALYGLREEAGRARDAAIDRRLQAVARDDAAVAAVEAAEQAERAARDALQLLERQVRVLEAAQQLATRRGDLDRADGARRDIEAGEAALRGLVLPAASLQALERLDTEIAGLRAAEMAQSPIIRMDYQAGVAGTVAIGGTALADGEERAVTGAVSIAIAGIGTLTLRPPRDASKGNDLATAERKRRDLLETLKVGSLAEARQRDGAARDKKTEIDLAKQRLSLLAPKGLAPLRDEVARLERESRAESAGGEALAPTGALEPARHALVDAEFRVAEARSAARETRPACDKAGTAVFEAEKAFNLVGAELDGIEAKLGPEAGRAEREAALSGDFSDANTAFEAAEQHVEALRAGQPDLANAKATLDRARSALANAAKEVADLREQRGNLNTQIRAQSDDAVEEAWREAEGARALAEARVVRLEREVAILTRLRDALEAARTTARDHYFEPVMKELRPLLNLLFDDASIVFDDETLLPRTVQRNGQVEDIDRLSGGMREQMAVLTRLAFARLLARDGRPAPIILDDALVYSDDDRIEKMFDALHRQSREQQIIVFSCRQRAFEQLGGNRLRLTDWKPDL